MGVSLLTLVTRFPSAEIMVVTLPQGMALTSTYESTGGGATAVRYPRYPPTRRTRATTAAPICLSGRGAFFGASGCWMMVLAGAGATAAAAMAALDLPVEPWTTVLLASASDVAWLPAALTSF